MKTIRSTTALSCVTLQEIDASIIEDEAGVFLLKEDGERFLLERDAVFFSKQCIAYPDSPRYFDKVMIDVTTRCNLNCGVCYRKATPLPDPGLPLLQRLAGKFNGKIISLCGGEPTVREDLPELIALFSRRNTVFLITNGIRLADLDYLLTLKKNGLRYVSFSLNALSEEVMARINGAAVLEKKLKALENLKKTGTKTVLAFVLVPGVYESELKGIFELCMRNLDFIRELRIRTMAPLGAYLDAQRLCLSEVIETVIGRLGLEREEVFGEFELKRTVNRFFNREVFSIKSCSFDFHVRKRRRRPTRMKEPSSIAEALLGLVGLFGAGLVLRGAAKLVFRRYSTPWVHSRGMLKVGLRCWPDVHSLDCQENRRCRTGYWLDGRCVSFCYANILKDRAGGEV